MANPRKFSEKIALHTQKQAEETAEFEKIMREVSDVTNKVNSNSRRPRVKAPPEPAVNNDSSLRPIPQGLGTFRSGSLPNVAAPQMVTAEPETVKPEENLATQYGLPGGHSTGTSPSRGPVQRGRTSSSVGPMRRPSDRRHDTSPYGSSAYLSPPPDSNWRRTNSDSALHQSCGEQLQAGAQPLSQHHPLHSHAHPHNAHTHQNHRRATADMHQNALASLGMNPTNRPRSSCEIPRIPNNNNVYESGGDGGGGGAGAGGGGGGASVGAGVGGAGGLACGELAVPGGSLPDLTSVHFPAPHYLPHRTSPEYHHQPRYSPSSPGAVSPGAGSVSPATGGLSPASGSPVGATVPLATSMHHPHEHASLYDTQNHLSVPNTNSYLHHNKNISQLDHNWIASSYQSQCSPPSQYSSTSNINIPSPTMVHSPGSPVGSPQTDYNNIHQALLQPFEQITMLDSPVSNYNTSYMNHGSPHSPQTTNSTHTYSQLVNPPASSYNTTYINHSSPHSTQTTSSTHTYSQAQHAQAHTHAQETGRSRDPVAGGAGFPPLQALSSPAPPTPASIPDIILTDYSGELDASIFGSEEAQLRESLDLDDLTMLEEPGSLLPDSSVEQEFRLDRL